MRYLYLLFLFFLASCKTLDPAIATSATSMASATTHTHDTVVIHDSIFVREYMAGDTIYRDRIQYRDRWRTHIVHDTILHTDSIVQIIEPPPERYIPPFYKRCTTILWIILAASIVYLIFRWRLRL